MNEREEKFLTAIINGDKNQVETMVHEDPKLVNTHNASGLSAVTVAAYYEEPDIARLLIDHGAQLNIFDAAAAGSLAHVVALVNDQPLFVNSYSPDGFQPLGLAAFFGHIEIVAFLLARGAVVNAPSQNAMQVTPLHSAVAHRRLAIAEMLLANGADPNARQAGGFTPLHSAAQNGQMEMVELLLRSGADPVARNTDGKTPSDLAREAGHETVADHMEE